MRNLIEKTDKIFICGISGSGKTTLAKNISKKYGHTPIFMDEHFWQENWTQRPLVEFVEKLDDLTSGQRWVLEGATGTVIERYAPKADLVIWLNFNRYFAIYRVIKRTLSFRGRKTREEMADGCTEKIDFEFLKWIWNYPKNKNHKILKYFEERNVNFYEIKNPRGLKRFLRG